ncbi:MAG: hypothetical protein E7191_05405 [Erysipelotrichaceae bacterium]|nr:hypothetical protein [Erysipelotrichaceae bacterium]
MKKLLRKMDEMERYISNRSQSTAYIYLLLALFVWTMYESYKVYAYHTTLNIIPCFLLVSSTLVQSFTQYYMQRNAVKDDDEYTDNSSLLKIILLICAIASLIASIGAVIVIMGAKV